MTSSLPTGKPHVSFSEIREWTECPHRHKLHHIDKIDNAEPSPILEFGTAVHSCCEHYLKTRIVDLSIVRAALDKAWEDHAGKKGFESSEKEKLLECSAQIMADVPTFLETKFPGWEYLAAEELLYENIDKSDVKFKGMIDGVLVVPTKVRTKIKKMIWIIDWKTSAWGWSPQKKSDPMVQAQIILYKHFWSGKHGVDAKDIRCGFVLLKKSGKAGARCELIPVSVGPVSVGKSLKMLNNTIAGMKRGIALKNRNSCKYCEFYQTEHCK